MRIQSVREERFYGFQKRDRRDLSLAGSVHERIYLGVFGAEFEGEYPRGLRDHRGGRGALYHPRASENGDRAFGYPLSFFKILIK